MFSVRENGIVPVDMMRGRALVRYGLCVRGGELSTGLRLSKSCTLGYACPGTSFVLCHAAMTAHLLRALAEV